MAKWQTANETAASDRAQLIRQALQTPCTWGSTSTLHFVALRNDPGAMEVPQQASAAIQYRGEGYSKELVAAMQRWYGNRTESIRRVIEPLKLSRGCPCLLGRLMWYSNSTTERVVEILLHV